MNAADPSTLTVALLALLTTAGLVFIMLGLLIWSGRAELAGVRRELLIAQTEAATGRDEVARLQQEAEALHVTSPMEWTTCLACRAPLAVVLCPHCHAPYHREQISPRGVKLDCWAAVVAGGRCWHCKGDLTAFQPRQPATTGPARPTGQPISLLAQRDSPGVLSALLPPRPGPRPVADEDFQIVAGQADRT